MTCILNRRGVSSIIFATYQLPDEIRWEETKTSWKRLHRLLFLERFNYYNHYDNVTIEHAVSQQSTSLTPQWQAVIGTLVTKSNWSCYRAFESSLTECSAYSTEDEAVRWWAFVWSGWLSTSCLRHSHTFGSWAETALFIVAGGCRSPDPLGPHRPAIIALLKRTAPGVGFCRCSFFQLHIAMHFLNAPRVSIQAPLIT